MQEEELHGEYDRPFGPMPSEGVEAIRVHEVREPFEAWARGGERREAVGQLKGIRPVRRGPFIGCRCSRR